MANPLTSWKEVAQYLGKGVRTVQRWEKHLGLPVRRPDGRAKGVVLALPDELDRWMRSEFQAQAESEVDLLRHELAELKKENGLLRSTLEGLMTGSGSNGWETVAAEILRKRCLLALNRSTVIRLQSAEVIEMSLNLRALRQMQREQALKPPPPAFPGS